MSMEIRQFTIELLITLETTGHKELEEKISLEILAIIRNVIL